MYTCCYVVCVLMYYYFSSCFYGGLGRLCSCDICFYVFWFSLNVAYSQPSFFLCASSLWQAGSCVDKTNKEIQLMRSYANSTLTSLCSCRCHRFIVALSQIHDLCCQGDTRASNGQHENIQDVPNLACLGRGLHNPFVQHLLV